MPAVGILQNQLLRYVLAHGQYPVTYCTLKCKAVLWYVDKAIFKVDTCSTEVNHIEKVIPGHTNGEMTIFDILLLFYNKWIYERKKKIVKQFIYESPYATNITSRATFLNMQLLFPLENHRGLFPWNSTYFNFKRWFKNKPSIPGYKKKLDKELKFFKQFKENILDDETWMENYEINMFDWIGREHDFDAFMKFLQSEDSTNWACDYDFEYELKEYNKFFGITPKENASPRKQSSREVKSTVGPFQVVYENDIASIAQSRERSDDDIARQSTVLDAMQAMPSSTNVHQVIELNNMKHKLLELTLQEVTKNEEAMTLANSIIQQSKQVSSVSDINAVSAMNIEMGTATDCITKTEIDDLILLEM